MFRVTNNLKSLTQTIDALNLNFTNLQVVRWRRKPIGLPMAKSKLFRIPPRPVIPEDEDAELKRLNNNYRTQIKSLRRYLHNKYSVGMSQTIDHEHQHAIFEKDFKRCSEINDKWNESIKAAREEFFENDLLKTIEIAQQRLAERQGIQEAKLAEAENIVRTQKELSKDFITAENIDVAIEQVLANPVDYNFSIDLEGNRYYGRDTKPNREKVATKEKISIKQ